MAERGALLPDDDGYRKGHLSRLGPPERARLSKWVKAVAGHLEHPALARQVIKAFA